MACELLRDVLQAHGGLDRWNSYEKVQATIVTSGQMFGMKGTPQDPTPRRMTVATRREWASVTPYGADDQRTDFTANRIAIEKIDGTVVTERLRPSEHAEGKAVDAPWDSLDRRAFGERAYGRYFRRTEPIASGSPMPGEQRIHVVADAIAEVVADDAYAIQPGDQGTAVGGG